MFLQLDLLAPRSLSVSSLWLKYLPAGNFPTIISQADYLFDYSYGIFEDPRCCEETTDPNCRYIPSEKIGRKFWLKWLFGTGRNTTTRLQPSATGLRAGATSGSSRTAGAQAGERVASSGSRGALGIADLASITMLHRTAPWVDKISFSQIFKYWTNNITTIHYL